jgi:hypothetical protein
MVGRCRLKCARGTSSSWILPRVIPPFAPSITNPFIGFILPGAGASGINIIDNDMQNPSVQQFNLGIQHELPGRWFSASTASIILGHTSSSVAP